MCCIPRICLYIVFSVSRCQSGCKHSNSLCVLHINRICVVSHHQPNRWCQLTQRKLDFIRWPSEKRSCFIQIPYLNESSSKDPSRKYGCFHIAFPILKAMKNYPSGDLHLDRSHHGDEPRHCCDFGKLWGVSRETVPKKTLDEMECINLDLDLHAPTCWSFFFLDLWAVLCQFSSEFGQNSCGFCSELTNAQKDRNLDSRISDGFFVPYLIVLSFNCHFWKTDSQVSSSIVINTDVRKITQHTPSTKQTRMTKKRITRKCSVMVFEWGKGVGDSLGRGPIF